MWAGGVFSVGPFGLVGSEDRGGEGITGKYKSGKGRGVPAGSLTQAHTLSLTNSILCVCSLAPSCVCVTMLPGCGSKGTWTFSLPVSRSYGWPRLAPCHCRCC